MENFELIEEYVAGRLEGPEKEAFEQKLNADPSLKSDVTLQRQIIEGVKKARTAELKTMLSQVPVSGLMQAGLSAGQIAAGAIATTVIVTSSLVYFKPWEKSVTPEPIKTETPIVNNNPQKTSTSETIAATPDKAEKDITASAKSVKKNKPAAVKSSGKPKVEAFNPSDELEKESAKEKQAGSEAIQQQATHSRIAVETNTTNKDYTFHYQFAEGKLILYGTFDKGLYEIIEVNGTNHTVFLFYKETYYLLNERQTSITPLSPIKDAQLIRKLKDYRSQ